MYSAYLRQVGGSLMVSLPPAILGVFDLKPGSKVHINITEEALIIKPHKKSHYTLKELISQCDLQADLPQSDEAWLASPPVGKELI